MDREEVMVDRAADSWDVVMDLEGALAFMAALLAGRDWCRWCWFEAWLDGVELVEDCCWCWCLGCGWGCLGVW